MPGSVRAKQRTCTSPGTEWRRSAAREESEESTACNAEQKVGGRKGLGMRGKHVRAFGWDKISAGMRLG